MRRLVLFACASLFATAAAAQHYPWHGDYRPRPPAVMPNPPAEQVDPLARTATYVCEDLTTVVFTEGSPTAIATMNSGLQIGLAQRPSTVGFRYGAAPYEIRGRGDEAVLQSGEKLWRCRRQ